MSNNSQAALLASYSGEVIGLVYDAPEKGNTIVLAGAFTEDGTPVNCRKMRISRSKRNLEKAEYTQPVTKVGNVWTFHCVEDNQVVY